MKNPSKHLILVDGSSYLYRAFHALPALTSSRGEPTGALYGVINMIRKLVKDYKPEYMAVIFDAKGRNFRHDLYKDYKAHRPPMPDELVKQVEPLHELIKAMGLTLISMPGIEADDVIGTLATQALNAGWSVLISTGDKDMAQLVNAQISLINTMTNQIFSPTEVEEKFGVGPNKIIDYLALVGDSSDNIPGITKCGPKTAVKWLTEFGSLDNLIANADKIAGKVGENLRAELTQLALARTLVTIKCDFDLDLSLESLTVNSSDETKLANLYNRYEFKTWLAELKNPAILKIPEQNYTTIFSEEIFAELLTKIREANLFSFDLETTSLNYMDAEIIGFSFAIAPYKAAYLPVGHDYDGAPKQLNRDKVLAALKPILEDSQIFKIGQHLKYDRNVLLNYGIELQGIAYDTMLESYVFNSTTIRHDLSSLAAHYLGRDSITFEMIAGKGVNQKTFNQIHIEQASTYAAEDADLALQCHQKLWPLLETEARLAQVYETLELPLLPILSEIERTGVLIDSEKLFALSETFAEKMAELESSVYAEVGMEFNLDSPKQLQEILFDKLGLPILKKTPTGQASTAEPVLSELAESYKLPGKILEYRSLAKLKSTYTDKLPLLVNSKTGRVHTSYHQAITSTGRLSSSDPNLQNIPIRSKEGREIRQAFIAAQDYVLIAADYSQIELRIMAHLSQDKNLVQAFAKNQDVHRATAAEIFDVALEDVDLEHRRRAKAINFGLIYGMSAFGLAKQLGLDRYAAQSYIDRYFDRFPGVKRYMDETRQQAHERGFVETVFGRRLYLPEIHDRNKMRQQAAERAAINAPMQGTAADLIKVAMIHVHRKLKEARLNAKIIMQVHDELVIEAKATEQITVSEILNTEMSQAAKLDVPLLVDIGTGTNWDSAH